MFRPLKVIEIELSQPLIDLSPDDLSLEPNALKAYVALQVLLRWKGVPIGQLRLPLSNGYCLAAVQRQLILEQYEAAIVRQIQLDCLQGGSCDRVANSDERAQMQPFPTVTVAVCSRDRPEQLKICLDALVQLNYPQLEVLVIDNAPSSDATQQMVQQYATVRYIREPRPGLNWARNRAILESSGEILAFTDDDVRVDARWIHAIVQVFAADPEVMAVTGLVLAAELETEAQWWFEQNGGFSKGFQRRRLQRLDGQLHWTDLGTGSLGTGANMAFRKTLFKQIGGFDPALDVGTATNGAGDLELFFRVLKAGAGFVYEPSALVWHYHRREYHQLRTQLQNNGSVYAYFVRAVLAYPTMAAGFCRAGISWFWSGHVLPLLISLFYPAAFPRELRLAQIRGCLIGLVSYFKAQQQAAAIVTQWGNLEGVSPVQCRTKPASEAAIALGVSVIETTQPLSALDGRNFAAMRLFVMRNGSPLGSVTLTAGRILSPIDIGDKIVQELGETLISRDAARLHLDRLWGEVYCCTDLATVPTSISVSIVIGTYDRPDTLKNCLIDLLAQVTPRSIEIIVVDNHPQSGLTPPVIAEVRSKMPTGRSNQGRRSLQLLCESRQGVAYARNTGIAASRGEIIVTVDDDVSIPPDWLEKLLTPLARSEVMAVTGNVLPLELETKAQQLFESYGNGGLGRGFTAFEANRAWFERSWLFAVPTWKLGGTANSAYRAVLFSDPEIGRMNEALGPGMPSGVGEDIYLFYKILKAGGTIVYQPTAWVWHKHRRELSALKHQLYNYSKGFVAYHLTTLIEDQDYRSLMTLLVFLPLYRLKQVWCWLNGSRFYPLSLIGVEVAGNLVGASALWRSRRRVRQGDRLSDLQTGSDRTAHRMLVQLIQFIRSR